MSINHPKNKEFKEIFNEIMDDNGMNQRYWEDRAKQSGIDTAKFLKDLDEFEKKSRQVKLMVK